ncbi:MAG: YceI family protein [Acidobacteriota bacterium]
MSHQNRYLGRSLGGPALSALAVLAMLASAPSSAGAAMESYRIDPEHTNIGFRIRHFFSKVPGRFNKFEGTIRLDREDLASGSVEISIDTASIDTNDSARDKHLRSDAFFDVENHPKMTFRSTRIREVGPNQLEVEGNLTIRGVTKPVSLDVDVLGFGRGYGYRGGFEARTQIDRTDFGVSWNDVVEGGGVVLGNEVEIILNVEAVRLKEKPAGSSK